jgi:hypothetical protein
MTSMRDSSTTVPQVVSSPTVLAPEPRGRAVSTANTWTRWHFWISLQCPVWIFLGLCCVFPLS